MIIGILGLTNSGKSTVSDILQTNYNFSHISFADSLKEMLSSIFGWPIDLMKGKTSESRKWREEIDIWWANRLDIKEFSPRWAMQHIGTDILRNHFNQDIWVASVEKKLLNCNSDIVIDDCRFANEIEMIRQLNGVLIEVRRGDYPIWHDTAIEILNLIKHDGPVNYKMLFEKSYPNIHISEWGWANQPVNYHINNDSNLEELYNQIKVIMNTIK